jgi:uridine kinase
MLKLCLGCGVGIGSLRAVLADIAESEPINGIRLVGIDGPAGSGKTTLARRLGELAGAPVIELDDFMSWTDLDWWWPRFESEVLEPLLAGRDAQFAVRDWRGDPLGTSLAGQKTVPWAPLVFLEGVSSSRATVTMRLAYRIWVEAPELLRFTRGVQRDGESNREHWENWLRLESDFFAADRPRDRADRIVCSGSGLPHNPETELVAVDL